MKGKSKNPETKKIARDRIAALFHRAETEYTLHPERSDRYVELARRIAMRQRVRIDRPLRRRYCHHCAAYLMPGRNMRVRVSRGNVIVTCLVCGKKARYRVVKQDG